MMNFIFPSLILSLYGIFNIFGIRQAFFVNQLLYFIAGLVAYFIIKKIGFNFFWMNAKIFFWLFVISLFVTYLIGLEVKGSKRWIDLYFLRFQASEFLKAFFILYIAGLFAKVGRGQNSFKIFIKSLAFFLIPTFIIFKQPDLGNALVYIFIYVVMVTFSTLPKKYLIYLAGSILAILPLGWFILKQYQKLRILAFFNPHLDTQGTSYNMMQSIITVGSGKFIGRGLGLGTQSRLFFLPENHTDFAFASLVEQFGFLGGLAIIIFYLLIILVCFKKLIEFAKQDEQNNSYFLYVVGLTSYIFFQFIINVGMNLGLLPITGIALPFISYGGSSMVALMIAMALVP